MMGMRHAPSSVSQSAPGIVKQFREKSSVAIAGFVERWLAILFSANHGKGQSLQFEGEIDRLDRDDRVGRDDDWGKVEDAGNTRLLQSGCDRRCRRCRDSQNRQIDALLGGKGFQVVEMLDTQRPDARTDRVGIAIESSHEPKPELVESAVAAQGAAQIADPHENDIPGSVGTEDMLNGGDQVLDSVTHTPLADLPETG